MRAGIPGGNPAYCLAYRLELDEREEELPELRLGALERLGLDERLYELLLRLGELLERLYELLLRLGLLGRL